MSDDSPQPDGRSDRGPEPEPREFREWLQSVSNEGWIWYAKRLAANDTLATGGHQAGPYLPQELVRRAFPVVSARQASDLNPDTYLALRIDSHGEERDIRLVWYNNRIVSERGTRNEARLTNLGGQASPLLDPDATGALVVFAFALQTGRDCQVCRAWVCRGLAEATAAEEYLGPVEPGVGVVFAPARPPATPVEAGAQGCALTPSEFPTGWRASFPSAEDLVAKAVERLVELRNDGVSADDRLVRRRDCEFEMFRSLEDFHVLPLIAAGFREIEAFVALANIVTNRRKARSGRSLELHAAAIFTESGLPHSHGEVSEGNKRPDFLFPSDVAYHDARFPEGRLRMLAAKTTCKDRWRQILNEADRIRGRFLLTLQEGVSVNQWLEMKAHDVTLVVPRSLHRKFPEQVRPELWSLDRFIAETARLVGG